MLDGQDIITISAIAIPSLFALLTAIINNRHQRKMKWTDIYESRCIETIEKYIHGVNTFYFLGQNPDSDFMIVRNSVYLYVDPSLWPLLDDINSAIDLHQIIPAREHLAEFCKAVKFNHIREARITKARFGKRK